MLSGNYSSKAELNTKPSFIYLQQGKRAWGKEDAMREERTNDISARRHHDKRMVRGEGNGRQHIMEFSEINGDLRDALQMRPPHPHPSSPPVLLR